MLKPFLVGLFLFFLLTALGSGGGSPVQAQAAIPWNCDDWQAFAHDDRPTAILESLAENRGKTLYCGIDQSDTFAKAETWAAGKDRNERDDTVYFGERGQFRGFIAAQEGWLTDGESGITGQSIATIFEFPKEGRRIRRTKRLSIASEGNCPDPEDDRTPGTLACSAWGNPSNLYAGNGGPASKRDAQANYDGRGRYQTWTRDWETSTPRGDRSRQTLATDAAKSACRARGGKAVSNVVVGQGHSRDRNPTGGYDRGPHLGWFFDNRVASGVRFRARESRTWTATCKKVIRRSR